MATYEGQLDGLTAGITSSRKPTIISGDFNARSVQWGSDRTDARGHRLLRVCEQTGLIPVNSKGGPSFIRNHQQSRIDAIACSRTLKSRLKKSFVSRKYTGSDHNYLVHRFSATSAFESSSMNSAWNTQYGPPDKEAWISIIKSNLSLPPETELWIREQPIFIFDDTASIDAAIAELESWYATARISKSNNSTRKRRYVTWWSKEISKLRLNAARSQAKWRRTATRMSNNSSNILINPGHPLHQNMVSDRRTLIKAIRQGKDASWTEMINEVARDPWGKPYKRVMNRLKGKTPLMRLNETEFRSAVSQLFVTDPPVTPTVEIAHSATTPPPTPTTHSARPASGSIRTPTAQSRSLSPQPGPSWYNPGQPAFTGLPAPHSANQPEATASSRPSQQFVRPFPDAIQDPRIPFPFSARDAAEALGKVSRGKAPGRDGITGEALRPILKLAPEWIRDLFNACYRLGYFPNSWKVGRLVLIPKPGKPFNSYSDLRPLCMLSNLGKGFEYALRELLEEAVKNFGDLSPQQFGFRKKRSTMQAMKVVITEWDRARNFGNHCLLICLDVKNAFNTVR
ncbi:uncharacterized protein LOC114881158 [Osmia bicornis bicornis]|uniref:uncharacterized protein LOC114881158 n=1 Tax=Osmia bicornis bicornis TaxID=1437191 RepID=UPI0010F6B81C|nr:uncharacterized protein LOC114881158 [Osmia bicornis bicornis]